MKIQLIISALALALTPTTAVHAQSTTGEPILVTVDNFVRAESDLNLGNVAESGGLGKFIHHREPMRIEEQFVIRPNRDTLYSMAVFDFDAGPVTITLPDAGERYMSMQVISQEHYVSAVYHGPGSHTVTKEQVGTRYGAIGIRTLVDPGDPADVTQVTDLQDAIKVEQQSPGSFEVPDWDTVSQKKVREALLALAATVPDTKGMFGAKGEVNPVRHLIGAAMGWGGNPENEALYLNVTPSQNDGKMVYRLNVDDVPVDGFWSISVYNAKGYFEKNDLDAYSLNNITAKKGEDGSVDVQFGGCDSKIANCLPIMPGWNYLARLYRPRAEILDGSWKFPEARPVN
jgi:hypothetical protein